MTRRSRLKFMVRIVVLFLLLLGFSTQGKASCSHDFSPNSTQNMSCSADQDNGCNDTNHVCDCNCHQTCDAVSHVEFPFPLWSSFTEDLLTLPIRIISPIRETEPPIV